METDPINVEHDKELKVKLTKVTYQKIKALAQLFGTSQIAVVDASINLFNDYTQHVDVIQVPELICVVEDLKESVLMLLAQGEELERLGVELMALEMAPNTEEV